MTARITENAPAEAYGPSARRFPLRKREGFVPQVQRWSFQLPPGTAESVKAYGFYGEKYHLRLIPKAQAAATGAALSKQ